MLRTLTKTYNSAILEVIPAYQQTGNTWPAAVRELAVFAINNGYWEQNPSKLVSQCANDIRRAMREEKHATHKGEVCERCTQPSASVSRTTASKDKWYFGMTFAQQAENTWKLRFSSGASGYSVVASN
jgi:hypothetical protein